MSTTLNLFYYPTFIYEVEFRHVETVVVRTANSRIAKSGHMSAIGQLHIVIPLLRLPPGGVFQ